MKSVHIQYRFRLQGGKTERFDLRLDPRSLEVIQKTPRPLPKWTTLTYFRCPNCPLNPRISRHCPAAVCLTQWLERFALLLSPGEVMIRVKTPWRLISIQTSTRDGLASLMELLIVVSGCPHMSFLKPLARFHLPFGGNAESAWHAVSAYLMLQYFRAWDGGGRIDLEGLARHQVDMQAVHQGIAQRLGSLRCAAAKIDCAALSGIFTERMPLAVDAFIEEIRHLFGPYLHGIRNGKYL